MTVRPPSLALVGLGLFACVATTAVAADLKIGAAMPTITAVKAADGKELGPADLSGAKATVVCFTCNACPVARAYEERFVKFAKEYAAKGVKFVAVNCNEGESLEAMAARAKEAGFSFPYVYDATGQTGKTFGADVTPELFVFDGSGRLAYHGGFDNNMSSPTKHFVAEAVDAVLAGKPVDVSENEPFGCGIKYKR